MPAAGARLNARCCSAFKCPVSVKALALYLKTLYLIHFFVINEWT
jgi:hypothetical protein